MVATSQNRPLRILQVVGKMDRGGVETWLLHVLRAIDPRRYQMHFLVHSSEAGAYDRDVRQLGGQIIPCPYTRRPLSYARAFRRVLRECGPFDVVHSHVYLFSGYVLRLAAQSGVPCRIGHVHPHVDAKQDRSLRQWYRRLMAGWLARYSTVLLAPSLCSAEATRRLIGPCRQPLEVLYNAVDYSRFKDAVDRNQVRTAYDLPLDEPLVICVARFAPHKNQDQVLRIADRFQACGRAGHFCLVGSTGQRLQHFKTEAARRANVSVLTDVADVPPLLQAADLFFFPSLNEGFGIAVAEAAAAGLPVVATDLPTIREACPENMHDFLIAPNDDDQAFAHITSLLEAPELAQQLAPRARQFAQQFSIADSVQKLAAIYERFAAPSAMRGAAA